MRRKQHTPRYAAARDTMTMRARALKPKRKRSKRAGSGAKRSLIGAPIALLALTLAAYGTHTFVKWLHRAPEYVVKEIHVEGAALFTPEEILEEAGLEPGLPILDYEIHGARRKLVTNSMIRTASITRRLPNTIVVRIVERVPIAQLSNGWLVDGDGFLLTENDSLATLPTIKGVSLKDPKEGTRVEDKKLSAALRIIRLYLASSLPELMQIETVDVHNLRKVRLYPLPGPNTCAGAHFMLGDGQFGQRLAKLDEILRKQASRVKYADLRLQRVPVRTE